MKNSMRIFLVCAGLLAALAASGERAHATGLGFYGTLGAGNFDGDIKPDLGAKVSASDNLTKLGAGFAFDTNCATSQLINYRLLAGFETTDVNQNAWKRNESFASFSIDNILGFGLVATKEMRFWVGPELRAGYMWGTGSGFTKDANSVVLGLGGAAGINYHLGEDYDLAFQAGVRNEWLNGTWNYSNASKGDFDGNQTYGYFTISFLWRSLDDKFGATK